MISPGNELVFGDELMNICYQYKNQLDQIDLGFSLHDQYDQGIANLYSSYQSVLFSSTESFITVKCILPEISFTPGNVVFRGRILVDGEESDSYQGKLGEIMIEMGDFYQTGIIGQSNWGKQLIKGRWSKL